MSCADVTVRRPLRSDPHEEGCCGEPWLGDDTGPTGGRCPDGCTRRYTCKEMLMASAGLGSIVVRGRRAAVVSLLLHSG